MKTFELSSKEQKNGRRKFKVVLHEIYPDSAIDAETGIGTVMNTNGITWIEKYCQDAIESIKGMSLRCEFLDEDRTELCGHGETGIVNREPIFENAVVIGIFEDGYIEEILNEDGEKITACIGTGTIDSACYHNLCTKLDNDIQNGIYPYGSVEIKKKPDKDSIIYLGGHTGKGRIPTEFEYGGYALLGITPADPEARLLELNKQKEEPNTMTDVEIKNLVKETVQLYTDHVSEINQCKEDYDNKVKELNEVIETITAEKNEIIANSEQIQQALDGIKQEYEELNKKYESLWKEREILEAALAEAKAKERINELNVALSEFSDEEKNYAKAEIDAFNESPIESEINSVVDKILVGIGKKAKQEAAIVAEQNAANSVTFEDIFSVVDVNPTEDDNIF